MPPPPPSAAQAAIQGEQWVDPWELEQAQMNEAMQLSMALEASTKTFEREQHYRAEYLVIFLTSVLWVSNATCTRLKMRPCSCPWVWNLPPGPSCASSTAQVRGGCVSPCGHEGTLHMGVGMRGQAVDCFPWRSAP